MDAPATPARGTSVAGWSAYRDEVVLSWLDGIVMVPPYGAEQCEPLMSRIHERG
ncbi:hypothetical protein [Streptomyces longisporus]|uniref:Uncharacterized protein n=1 Tax=Streptomyces longisporus TaxID=1948 RepID=A0ABN3LWK7_STRLO